MRPRGLRGGARAFVGRGTELELLHAIFRHTVEQREPHVVTLIGDAGVGEDHAGAGALAVARGSGAAAGATHRPVPCVRPPHLLGARRDPARAAWNPRERGAGRGASRLGDRQMLGLALGLDLTGDAHPLAVRDRFQEAWVEFLGELAADAPTVVLVEDLHWAEDPLLDLLERVCREVRGPLLVIGTARPELLDRRRSWGSWPAQRLARLAGRSVAGRSCRDARRARARRALPNAALAGRASGGKSVLPRRAAGRLHRDRRGRRGAPGLGPGDPLGARGSARGRGEGRAAGGVGDRPRLLERADPRARRLRAARLEGAGGPRFHPSALDIVDRR